MANDAEGGSQMTQWANLTWRELAAASIADALVVLPIGCVETQGPYTPTGMEFIMSNRLAYDLATRVDAIALPTIPFGHSNLFQAIPGTVFVRPRVLTDLYSDVLRSVVRSGFRRILGLVYHIPNEPCFEEAARTVRSETGVSVVWINPGVLASTYLKEVLPDPAARGHGAEPALSLMRYLAGTEVPAEAKEVQGVHEYGGFEVRGPGLNFEGFSVGMPYNWDELYPETGGYGDVTLGSAAIGEALYNKILDFLCRLAYVIKSGEPVGRPVDVSAPTSGTSTAVG